MGPTVTIDKGMCWWCRERPADSREHKFKRSDLVREHGRGELRGEQTIVRFGASGSRNVRSTKNDALKFPPSLCSDCNNARSQTADGAYDRFVEWVFANEEQVLAQRRIDLAAALGPEWSPEAENVLRYFVKNALCRIVETHPGPEEVELPADAIAFLDGDPFPTSFACNFWIEPTWLRFCEKGEGDPLWVRPMGFDPLFKERSGRIAGRSYYGWLSFGWEFWGESEGQPFRERFEPLPILATRAVDLEFVLVQTTAPGPEAGDEAAREWVQKISGGAAGEPIIPEGNLAHSRIGQSFMAGALDFEAATRNLAPDDRDLIVADPPSPIETELRRAALLCGLARQVWATCSTDLNEIHSLALHESLVHPDAIHPAVEELRAEESGDGWPEVCNGFAAMASLKMIEAYEHGAETQAGEEALQQAASIAGACAAAVGAASENWPAAWDAINAAAAKIARVKI